jgi:hypothetical protein
MATGFARSRAKYTVQPNVAPVGEADAVSAGEGTAVGRATGAAHDVNSSASSAQAEAIFIFIPRSATSVAVPVWANEGRAARPH